MRLFFKSKIYQIEIQRWTLYLLLSTWCIIASALALQNRKEIILVGIDSTGTTRIITDKNDRFLQEEFKNFFREFTTYYFQYDQTNFGQRISKATDLMSQELWNSEKAKLLEIAENLKKEPLTQSFEIISMDLVEENRVEMVLDLKIQQRFADRSLKLKVNLETKLRTRTITNPWGYEVTEMNYVIL